RTCSGRCTERRSLHERRGRDARLAANLLEQQRDLVDVAPAPVLARLELADERMRRRVLVGGRMAARRAVAASDMAAGQADAQVKPPAAALQALLAAFHLSGKLAHRNLVEMRAGARAHRTAAGVAARCECTSCTAIEPSPTAVAQRFVEPDRTSPAAKMPGTLVSSRLGAPAASPVRMKPSSSRATAPPSHSVHGRAPRKKKRTENGKCTSSVRVTPSRRP